MVGGQGVKRGTPDHPKTKRLARILGLEDWGPVGILEKLWHFTAKHAIRGDIGKWSDDEIADAVGWRGDTALLLNALIDSGWLDRSERHRLIVHDWHDHADESVRKTIKNRRETFAAIGDQSRGFPEKSGNFLETSRNGRPQPEPEPEPEPSLSLIPTTTTTTTTEGKDTSGGNTDWQGIYDEFFIAAGKTLGITGEPSPTLRDTLMRASYLAATWLSMDWLVAACRTAKAGAKKNLTNFLKAVLANTSGVDRDEFFRQFDPIVVPEQYRKAPKRAEP